MLLVLGIFIGSYIAAKGSKEFRWRLPDIKTIAIVRLVAYLWDLVLQLQVVALSVMVVETATMSWQGWIALASMIIGVWFMSYFIL